MTDPRVPTSTYRLQCHRGLRFADVRALIPYLHQLGITDLYTSPLLKSRTGSLHGYDITDPLQLNPELGTEEDFDALVQELVSHGMGLLLDIVPNHMAASPENPWWMDVLTHGPRSPYASYFDIDWHPASAKGVWDNQVLLPILGQPYGRALENQELTLCLDGEGFVIRHHAQNLPLAPQSYGRILTHRLDDLRRHLGNEHPGVQALEELMAMLARLPLWTGSDATNNDGRREQLQAVGRRFSSLYASFPDIRGFLEENVRILNGSKGDPESFDRLDRLLAEQAYRLAFWRVAQEKINYRRFFDINDLIGMRMEDPQVIEGTHALIFRLIQAGKVTGLRIDHIDGLADPLDYLRRLQRHVPPGTSAQPSAAALYVIVEKILMGDETLPGEWPVSGTTGYDFLNTVNGVFVDPSGMDTLELMYAGLTGSEGAFSDVVAQAKERVIEDLFTGEMRRLGHQLAILAEHDRYARDLSPKELEQALIEITACLPVYRTYIRDFVVSPRDRPYIEHAVKEATQRHPSLSPAPFDFLGRVLLLDFPVSLPREQRQAWLRYVKRWQQLTGLVMAKGFEDTALYRYTRLVSLNEVGGDPEGGDQLGDLLMFHRRNQARLAGWPHTLNATSTHDTKRGEDVRARINVLSELPEGWARALHRWSRWNRGKKRCLHGELMPDANMEVLLYQTLLGAWPLTDEQLPQFTERLQAYMVKAAREAKLHTSWIQPDAEYEEALVGFVETILEASNTNRFLEDFLRFQKRVAYYGMLNALGQVLLKITLPGVPDLYQGTELWDFNLVDPDNRRPVDFGVRTALLRELQRRASQDQVGLAQALLSDWKEFSIKLYVTYQALHFRRTHRDLFLEGDYISLSATGRRRAHVCAFARCRRGMWAVVAIPRWCTRLGPAGRAPVGRAIWGATSLLLPPDTPTYWRNILTGETLRTTREGANIVGLHDVFRRFPVALLQGVTTDT